MKYLLTILLAFTAVVNFSQTEDKIIVVIDPGHGGKDPGNLNVGEGLKDEKDLNLEIALKLGSYIEQFLGHRIEVVYTRKTDEFVELKDRVAMANNLKASYLISVHCNAADNVNAHGTETHIHNIDTKVSNKLAHKIDDQLKNRAGRNSRGVKLSNDRMQTLYMLKYSKMPSVLVECGFMTNTEEEIYLNSEKGQDILASAVFRAFRDFVKTKHKIEMKAPEVAKDSIPVGPVWKVQVMASTGPVALDNPDFTTLPEKVEELQIANPTSTFTYKYYVGAYPDKKKAKDLLKVVRQGVFKDAFLVKFE
jgi:N-acetylmuramoyl-L-alanine amidase